MDRQGADGPEQDHGRTEDEERGPSSAPARSAQKQSLLERFNGLVTFNGRTFDVPLIETRYLFHRLESPFAALPHFDMLQPARKLWRR